MKQAPEKKTERPKKSKIWENKNSPEFREWIKEQAMAGSGLRSPEFADYARLVQAESERVYEKQSPREERDEIWRNYLVSLDLDTEYLKRKRILDLGCHEGGFVSICREKGFTEEAYGVDIEPQGEAVHPENASRFFASDYSEGLPVGDMDLVVSLGAVSIYVNRETEKETEASFRHAIEALKPGGEMRVFPVESVPEGTVFSGVEEGYAVFMDILQRLEKDYGISWRLIPIDISVSRKNADDVALANLLIIEKPDDQE